VSTVDELKAWAQGELKALARDTDRHEALLMGRGKDGIVQSVAKTEEAVMQMRAMVRDMEKTQNKMFTRMERAAAAIEAHSEDTLRRLKAVESLVGPMVDWKKGIVLRITTLGGTLAAIWGVAWWVVDHVEPIKSAWQAALKWGGS
jgi:hypothetical protein